MEQSRGTLKTKGTVVATDVGSVFYASPIEQDWHSQGFAEEAARWVAEQIEQALSSLPTKPTEWDYEQSVLNVTWPWLQFTVGFQLTRVAANKQSPLFTNPASRHFGQPPKDSTDVSKVKSELECNDGLLSDLLRRLEALGFRISGGGVIFPSKAWFEGR